MDINSFYKGQKVKFIDDKYNGHYYTEYNNDDYFKGILKYGKDPKENSWTQPDLNFGEICEVIMPQCTPTGIRVKKEDGRECVSLWQWFIDAEEDCKNINRTKLIDDMLETT
jgi:hypothetical protein